jgi:hypothetical protein
VAFSLVWPATCSLDRNGVARSDVERNRGVDLIEAAEPRRESGVGGRGLDASNGHPHRVYRSGEGLHPWRCLAGRCRWIHRAQTTAIEHDHISGAHGIGGIRENEPSGVEAVDVALRARKPEDLGLRGCHIYTVATSLANAPVFGICDKQGPGPITATP